MILSPHRVIRGEGKGTPQRRLAGALRELRASIPISTGANRSWRLVLGIQMQSLVGGASEDLVSVSGLCRVVHVGKLGESHRKAKLFTDRCG